MQDKFLKTLIYILIGFLLIIFLLIQPYNLFCKFSGACNPILVSKIISHKKGQNQMNVIFKAEIDQNLKDLVKFYPKQESISDFTGVLIRNTYYLQNLTDRKISIGAKYFPSPKEINKYLDRIECLCSKIYHLNANQKIEMPVDFIISSKIQKDKKLSNKKEIEIKYRVYER